MTTTILNREDMPLRIEETTVISGTMDAVNDVLGDIVDAQGHQSISVQLLTGFTGTVQFEVSNDKTNWVAKTLVSNSGASASSATGAGIWSGDIGARYFRVRPSALTAGTVTAILEFSPKSQSYGTTNQTVSGTVTANLGTGGTGATSLGKAEDAAHASGDTGVAIFGVRNPATPASQTSAAGDYGAVAIDAEGKQVIAGQGAADLTWDSLTNHTAATTDVALRAAQAAGIRTFLKMLIIENTGASAARLTVRDGTTNKMSFTIPAGQTLIVPFEQPLRGSAATALNAQLAAVGTVTVTALGFSGV